MPKWSWCAACEVFFPWRWDVTHCPTCRGLLKDEESKARR